MAGRANSGAEAEIQKLPRRASGLLPAPPAELDPVLDAASRCFARFGLRRTSVQDVARELGVNRTTVYRQVGNVDQLARLLAARELHRFLALLPKLTAGATGPEAVVEALAAVIEGARNHPVGAKLLADEGEFVGAAVSRYVSQFVATTAEMVAPLLKAGMRSGQLAHRNPRITAEWIVRVGVSLVLSEAPGDLRKFLSELLVPALRPEVTQS